MAKRRNVSGRVLRNAVPQPRDVAEFVAPRTVNEGLSVKNVFGDVGEMIDPFITAAIEKEEGLRDVSDDELKMLALLGSIPVAGAVAGKVAKKINKLVPNPKGGFIVLPKPNGENKLKDVIEASNAAGHTITPEIENEIRTYIGLRKDLNKNRSPKKVKQTLNYLEKMSPEARQVSEGYMNQFENVGGVTRKPQGFDALSPDERIAYFKRHSSEDDLNDIIANHNKRYKGHKDYGVIDQDYLDEDDYLKALYDKEIEEEAAAKAAEAARPITTTQVQELSTGIVPGQASAPKGGTRPTYDHSKQFMDTELKQVPGIDRTGMSYGDDTDAFYDVYKAWRNSKPESRKRASNFAGYDVAGTEAILDVLHEARTGKKRSSAMMKQTDPYYAAGVVGDENKRLWDRIKFWRERGKSDSEIRSLLQKDLDKYQGNLERLKARMPSKAPGIGTFDYEGAQTIALRALPSEEARALKALGIDTPEYDDLERLGNFYRVFFPE